MKQKHSRKPSQFRKIALDRIGILFKQAQLMYEEDPKLSNRYVRLARTIAMKYKVKFPRELKRKFCKNCYHFLVPGKNSRVRIQKGRLTIYCSDCKQYTRVPLR
ncbi:ribonuclease P protein component 4 [Nanoarchaeota archaeon]